MFTHRGFIRTALSTAISTMVLSGGSMMVQAQDAKNSSDDSSANFLRLEEVVVTAQKREQNANDIGISIAAVGGEQLKNLGVSNTADLAAYVPGLTYADSGFAIPIYTLRGVGFNENSVQATATVGLYNDQVAIPFPIMSAGLSMDMNRVEVLKGPQGTVFGRNATGGAINNIVNKPTDEFEGSVSFDYSRFDTTDVTGVLNVPISDMVGLRVAARKVDSSEGWQKSVSRDETLGEKDKFSARALLSLTPSEDLDILFAYNYWTDDSDSQVPQFLQRKQFLLSPIASIVQYFIDDSPYGNVPLFGTNDNQLADWVGGNSRTADPTMDMKNESFVATVNWDINEDITLTSLTSFNQFENFGRYDNSGWGGVPLRGVFTPFDVTGEGETRPRTPQDTITPLVRDLYDEYDTVGGTSFVSDATIDAFSQELRLSGDTGSVNWLVGVTYSEDEVDSEQFQLLDFASQGNNSPFVPFGLQSARNTTFQEAKNWGIFTHTEWSLSEELNLTLGLRYDEDDKSYSGCTRDIGTGESAFTLGLLLLGDTTAFEPGGCTGLDLEGNPLTGEFEADLKEDSLSWKIGLDYDVSADTLVYASYSRGFKSGSFPTLTATRARALLPVVQEQLDAYEIGVKSDLLDGSMHLNAAAFYYDYTDKQLFTKVIDESAGGVLNTLDNVPESSVQGAEFDIAWYPANGLLISLAATYINTEVKGQFAGYNQFGIEAEFSGSEFPYSPKLQSTFIVNYDFAVSDTLNGFANLDVQYSAKAYSDYELAEILDNGQNGSSYAGVLAYNNVAVGDTNVGIDPVLVLPSTTIVGARVGIKSADNVWNVSLWARNLTDEYQLSYIRRSSDNVLGWTGRPRTYGISLGYNF